MQNINEAPAPENVSSNGSNLPAPPNIVLPNWFRPIRAAADWDWTNEQKLVHSHMAVKNQTVPLMCNSLAGTGKTSSTLFGVNNYMGWAGSILLTAFGVDAAGQMQAKITNKAARALNVHKIGYAALAKMIEDGKKINTQKGQWKLHDIADDWLNNGPGQRVEKEEREECKDTFVEMMKMIRLNLIDPDDQTALFGMCMSYGIRAREDVMKAMPSAIRKSDSLALKEGFCDFTDMIYLPVKFNATFDKYDAVIVDEAQDLSMVTMLMTLRSVKPGGFYMVIGDPWQSIMMFAGAVSNGWDKIRTLINDHLHVEPRELRLTICQRCPTSVLSAVNTIYPEIGIRPRANAPVGQVKDMSGRFFPDLAVHGDAVGCRFNRPLIDVYFALVEVGKIPYFKSMGDGLAKRMEKMFLEISEDSRFKLANAEEFIDRFRNKREAELERKQADPY